MNLRRFYHLYLFGCLPLAFALLCGDLFLWLPKYVQLWYSLAIFLWPLGFLLLSSVRRNLSVIDMLWMSVPTGFVFFALGLAIWAALGFGLSIPVVAFGVYPLTFLIAFVIWRAGRPAEFPLRELIDGGDSKVTSFFYAGGYILLLAMISRWYGGYPYYPPDVDGQAIAGLIRKISEGNSYTSFFVPEIGREVGSYYPPGFLAIAAFVKSVSRWYSLEAMMVLTQFVLSMAPIVAMAVTKVVFRRNWYMPLAALFSIGSGFYIHMVGAGSTDAHGMLSAMMSFFAISQIHPGNVKRSWKAILLLAFCLGSALITNSIYFFYVAGGLPICCLLILIPKFSRMKFYRPSALRPRFVAVSIALGVALIIGVLLVYPILTGILNVQPKNVARWSTTIDRTQFSQAYNLLVERLHVGGLRELKDVYLAIFGLPILFFVPSLVALAVAGSTIFIFTHLSMDWIARVADPVLGPLYRLIPKYMYRYVQDDAINGHVNAPFVFVWHGPQDFSWISLDAFLFFFAVAFAFVAYEYVYVPMRGRIPIWSSLRTRTRCGVKVAALAVLLATAFYVQDYGPAKAYLYRFWQGEANQYPKNPSAEFVDYLRHKTDRESTFIIAPKWEFAFSGLKAIEWQYQWGWITSLTDRATFEERYLVFLNLSNMMNRASERIFKELTPKYVQYSEYVRSFYDHAGTTVPEGGFRAAGISHAIVPLEHSERILGPRRDTRIIMPVRISTKLQDHSFETKDFLFVEFL